MCVTVSWPRSPRLGALCLAVAGLLLLRRRQQSACCTVSQSSSWTRSSRNDLDDGGRLFIGGHPWWAVHIGSTTSSMVLRAQESQKQGFPVAVRLPVPFLEHDSTPCRMAILSSVVVSRTRAR